jgi:hypothetical protein
MLAGGFMAVMDAVMKLTRRLLMSNTMVGGEDPDDWTPEEESIGADPLTIEEIDDKWILFYADRIQNQIEVFLSQES